MLFAARQVQEKCREQQRDLYIVFVDLTKAFDSVSRTGLWMLLHRVGFPEKVINIIRSFHDGMQARVVDGGLESAPFDVDNGVKQGCVFAPLLFSIVMAAVIYDAFHNCEKGINFNVRYDGGIFNLRRFKAKTKVHHILVRELLYADDCALVAHTEEDVQVLIDCLSNATKRYGLSISIKKTEVLLQPKPGSCYKEPAVTIGSDNLRAVTKFCYLGGVLSNDCSIDLEIAARLAKASSTFGRLASRLWDTHDISLVTKVSVYQAAVLSVLLYGVETWTLYRRHIRQLDAFHMRCLRTEN